MAEAVLFQILDTLQIKIRNELVFRAQAGDSVREMKPEAVVIRKIRSLKSYQRPDEDYEQDELYPGLIITPPAKIIRPKEGGTNLRDDVYYNVLCQFIDGDGLRKDENIRTRFKWSEMLAKHFNAKPLLEVNGDEGCVDIVFATETDVVDEALFVGHDKFVTGVLLECRARENRTNE